MRDEHGSAGCLVCEIEAAIIARSREVRRELQIMNPITDQNYQGLFHVLVNVDADRRTLGGATRRGNKADA
jgi:hypothetical protein